MMGREPKWGRNGYYMGRKEVMGSVESLMYRQDMTVQNIQTMGTRNVKIYRTL